MTGKSLSERIGDLGHRLAVEAHAAWLAARDPRTPIVARVLAIAVAAYALSPIDLIPDFIPVLGWLDDLLIVPLGLWAVRRMIPDTLWAELHAAAETAGDRPSSRVGMGFILLLWAGLLYLVYWAVRTSPVH
ncbi:MAG: DUF1232 domain-containing protein [Sphingopyxis sp.]|uniref:YkvA family protein n=1 Tax=Sphingopyxis sp. TaxID=1908224 RepID=UPI003D8103B7